MTGFTDAEGSFQLIVNPSKESRIGWRIEIRYIIVLHKKDIDLLNRIQYYFGGIGKIRTEGKFVSYTVTSVKDLPEIIKHFDSYPLITQKLADYLLFKQAVELVKNKEHLIVEGIQKLVAIKASMNKGLSDKLLNSFSPKGVMPVLRPEVKFSGVPNPSWFSGFTDVMVVSLLKYINLNQLN